MQPDTENENREYNTNEIADIVAIAVSTVRKYCTILEKAGYLFTKKMLTDIGFLRENDVRVLTEMKNLSAKNIPLDRIADMIVLREKN